MQTLNEQLNFFRRYHITNNAKLMHYIGFPLLFLGLLMLLHWFKIDIAMQFRISFAWLLVVAMVVYYFFLDIKAAVATAIVLIIFTFIAGFLAGPMPTAFSFLLFLIVLIAGGALLYLSMKSEPLKPSLTEMGYLLLIAPLALVLELMQRFGLDGTPTIKKDNDIHHL